MSREFVRLSAMLVLAAASSEVLADKPEPITVRIIGFNDYHGNLQTPGTFGANTTVPVAQRPAVGGAEYLAAYVAKLKAENPYNVVVGAGDFIGASPLISALFYDEPSIETLNRIGLEFNAVGNHEFDKGSAELLRLQNGGCKAVNGVIDANSCRGAEVGTPVPFEGAKFQWLSANVVNKSTGRTLLPAYGVKMFKARAPNVKVGFIGMTLKGTPGIVTPTGVAGLDFLDEASTVNALIPRLKDEGVRAVVVLVHQGGFQNGANNANDINGCLGDLKNTDGSDSEIRRIVAGLDDAVDLVISGHTHAAYNCSTNTVDVTTGSPPKYTQRSTGLPNKAGRLVPVVSSSAFGRVLSSIDVTIDPTTKDVVAVNAENVLVDRTDPVASGWVTANPQVAGIVSGYNLLQAPLAGQVIGTISEPLPNTSDVNGSMPAGDLIADAQLQATQPAGLGGAVMAFMNPGGVRSPGFAFAGATYPYNITYGNAFTVQPFGNSLVTMTLTAQQLKNLLEQQFVGCLGQGTQRILQVSNGIKYKWSATAPACAKIQELSLTPTDVSAVPPVVTGTTEQIITSGALVVPPTKTYRITVNNFLATGGDGFSVLVGGTNQLGGAQDIDALVSYLNGYKAPGPVYMPGSPLLQKPRITRVP
jgi:5'-nucleotidase